MIRIKLVLIVATLTLFVVGCVPIETCDNELKNSACKCSDFKPYKRASFPNECNKEFVVINPDSIEAKLCQDTKECMSFDLLKFDFQKCDMTQVTYRCSSQSIFT